MYPAKGLLLNFDNSNNNATQTLFSITVTAPSGYKTKKEIGIGTSCETVTKVYGSQVDTAATTDTNITVGSVYGGIIFECMNSVVSKIFVGAAAE